MGTVFLITVLALGFLALFITSAYAKGKDPAKSWRFNALTAKKDPNSDKYISSMKEYTNVKKVLVMCEWGVAMATAKPDSPCYPVKLLKPKSGRLDKKLCIPHGTRPDKSADAALTVYDPQNGREHDLWRAKYKNGKIVSAVNAMSFPAGADNEVDKDGAKGGSNLGCVPLRRGTVTPEDLEHGITQTMQMALPEIGKGAPRWPAVHSFGRTAHGKRNNKVKPWSMVAGTWIRLSPSVNIDNKGLQPWEVTIARGLQTHGAIIRDFSRKVIIYGKDTINNKAGEKRFVDIGQGIKAGGGYCPNGDAKAAVFSPSFPWGSLEVLVPLKNAPKGKPQPRTMSAMKSGACWKTCTKSCLRSLKKGSKKAKKAKCATKICPARCKTKGH